MMQFPDLIQSDPEWHEFEWWDRLVAPWEPNQHYQIGDIVIPVASVGLVAVCSAAGLSKQREPAWSDVEAATITEGVLVWTMTDPAAGAMADVVSCVYSISPAGIVELSDDVNAAKWLTRVRLDASAADLGTYTITATLTDSTGEDHVIRATVDVI